MKKGMIQKIAAVCVLAVILSLCGCGKSEQRKVIHVLHNYFIYCNDENIMIESLEWTDTWEEVKKARNIQEQEVLREETQGEFGNEKYVESSLWGGDGCEAEERYSFTDADELCHVQVTLKMSSEEAVRECLNEIVPWAKNALPSPASSPETWEKNTDEIVEEIIKGETLTYWIAPDGSRFKIDVEPSGDYTTVILAARTPRDTGSETGKSIADV